MAWMSASSIEVLRRGGTFFRQVVLEDLHLLPVWNGWFVADRGRVDGVLNKLHLVDVALAVGEDTLGLHADDKLGAGKLRHEGIVATDRCGALNAHAVRALEVDEEQADFGVD